MGGLGFWLRWSLRDLRRRWLLVTAISLVMAIGVGLYTGLGSLETWRLASNDASFARLNVHDFEISLAEGARADRGELARLVRSIPHARAIEHAEERLVVPTQIDASRGGETVLVPGRVVGVDVGRGGPRVDGIAAEPGRGLGPADRGAATGVIEANFGTYYDLPPSGTLRTAGGAELRYVGHGRSPEYFYIVAPGGGFNGEANLGVLFTSLETAQRVSGEPGGVNDMVISLAPGADAAAVRAELASAIRRDAPGATLTDTGDEAAYRLLYEDAGNDQRLMNVFSLLVLAGAALGVFNLVSRVVEAQRREIGVGMALGVSPRLLALRPLLLGLEIGVLSAALGIPVGLLLTRGFEAVLEAEMPLPAFETPFQTGLFLRGAALALVLPLLAAAYPVARGVRMAPVDAIRVGLRAAKGGGLAPLLRRVRLPGGSLGGLPLRNVLRAPRRTAMTTLALGAIIAVIVSMSGFLDSFTESIDRSERELTRGDPARMTIGLDDLYPRSSDVVRDLGGAPAVGPAEPGLKLGVELRSGSDRFDASVELADPASRLWRPSVARGEFRAGAPGILLAEEAAHDLRVDVGDTIVVRHPRRAAGGGLELADSRVRVVGVHPNTIRTFAYVNAPVAERMGFGGIANTVSIAPEPGRSQDEVKRSLFGRPGVATIESVSANSDATQEVLDQSAGFLRFAQLIMFGLALLMALNAAGINAEERAREHATMFAYGLRSASVIRVAMIESVLLGLLGALLGLAMGLAIVGWVTHALTPSTLPDLGIVTTISPASIGLALVAGVAAMAAAPLSLLRRLRRMDVPSTLRVVE